MGFPRFVSPWEKKRERWYERKRCRALLLASSQHRLSKKLYGYFQAADFPKPCMSHHGRVERWTHVRIHSDRYFFFTLQDKEIYLSSEDGAFFCKAYFFIDFYQRFIKVFELLCDKIYTCVYLYWMALKKLASSQFNQNAPNSSLYFTSDTILYFFFACFIFLYV